MALRIGTQGEVISKPKPPAQNLITGNFPTPTIQRDDTPSVNLSGLTAAPIQDYTGGGGSGGGGGGGGSAAAATAVAARPNLSDYLNNSYLRQQAVDEGARRLQEFDADTTRQRGLVTADQGLRRQQLQQNLDDQGVQNAETMAARGLLRSGLTLQNQDRINQSGNQQRGIIDQLLGTFEAQRAGARANAPQTLRR